jgi:hypothetical protein
MLKPKYSTIPVYALHIVSDESDNGKTLTQGKKMMEKALKQAAATENTLIPLTRYDMNISNGIIYTIKEQNITDVLIGLHNNWDQDNFLGPIAERILARTSETLFIYKSVQPFNTLKRMVVVVSGKAELEPGFSHWFAKLSTIAKEAGISIEFFGKEESLQELQDLNELSANPVQATFNRFVNWEDFLVFTRELKPNDLFVIISSRKGHVSYHAALEKLPYYLTNYFGQNSFIMLYPKQLEMGLNMSDVQHVDGSLMETLADKVSVVNKAGGLFSWIFRRKR